MSTSQFWKIPRVHKRRVNQIKAIETGQNRWGELFGGHLALGGKKGNGYTAQAVLGTGVLDHAPGVKKTTGESVETKKVSFLGFHGKKEKRRGAKSIGASSEVPLEISSIKLKGGRGWELLRPHATFLFFFRPSDESSQTSGFGRNSGATDSRASCRSEL